MLGPEFSSCWLKFGRAKKHADLMESEIAAWIDRKPYLVVQQNDANGSRYAEVVRVVYPPRLDQWKLAFGDLIHNLRSALDHFVYAAATLNKANPTASEERHLQFPICDTEVKFFAAKHCIAVLPRKVKTAIEGLQPYNRLRPELPPLLKLVRDFDNSDKHKLLSVLASQQAKGNIVVPPLAGVELTGGGYRSGPIEDGTEIAWVTVRPPKLGVNFQFSARIEIAIEHAPGPSGLPKSCVVPLSALLLDEVRDALNLLALSVIP